MMHLRQPNWTRILTIQLVIVATIVILYVLFLVLTRFTQAILLFVLGAIVAYVLMPLVNRLQAAFKTRWLAIVIAYGMVATLLFALAVMLFTPFIEQSKSLVDNLQTPTTSSLSSITRFEAETAGIEAQIKKQQQYLTNHLTLTPAQVSHVSKQIARLPHQVELIRKGTVFGRSHTPKAVNTPPGHVPPNPQPQTPVPPSYVGLIQSPVNRLSTDYPAAVSDPNNPDLFHLAQALTDARKAATGARKMYHIMDTTPILLIRAQTWLDSQSWLYQHGLRADLHDKFGQAAKQVSDQGTNLLNNAITILSEAANALLDVTLILIIAFYLLNDGRRIIYRSEELIPAQYRDQASFFLSSLDRVLGGYIRGQIFLSILAGILGGGGAAVLGVPYPLLIGIVTCLLEAIPVIGPMVAVVPAVIVSLFFMPFPITLALFIWFIIFQQVVTNILGPRIMGMAVGIHPLEALLAVLVGFPLGGFLGAFLAVPVAGIVHILIREAYGYWVLGESLPTAPSAVAEPVAAKPIPARSKPDSAAG